MSSNVKGRVGVPIFQPDEKIHRRAIADWCQWAAQGHLSNTGTVTLNANATTTTVTDEKVGSNTVPILQPATANAASVQSTVWVSTINVGSFIITHSNTASTDKTFRYALLG